MGTRYMRGAALAATIGAVLSLEAPIDVRAAEAGAAPKPAPAAGEKAAASSEPLEEIVVTARYRREALQQTPVAITAITAQDLERRQFTQASDIGYTIPNASLRPAQSAFGNTLTAFIRGIGQADFNLAFEPGVAIYVDDVYYPTTMATQFDLMDLERIEVARGPQGTLFGRGAIGGAMRYISKQPKGDNSGFVEMTGGSYSRFDVRAGYDFSLVPNKLFMRITGVSKQSDGYQKLIDFTCAHPDQAGTLPRLTNKSDCELGTLGGTDTKGVRTNLRFLANDVLEFGLSADYQVDHSESHADRITQILPFAGPWNSFMQAHYGVPYDSRFVSNNPYISYATFQDPYSGLQFPNEAHLTQKGISGTVDWQITDAVAAKLIVAWRNWKSTFGGDSDGSPLGLSGSRGREELTYRTEELRFTGVAFNKVLDWTVGAFFYDGSNGDGESAQAQNGLTLIPTSPYFTDPAGYTNGYPNALQVNSNDIGRYENKSGFVHAVINVTDKLHLTGGIRYSFDTKHDINTSLSPFAGVGITQSVEARQTSLDWLAGIDYQFTPNLMAYFSAATGYRPPAYNTRTFQPSQFTSVNGEQLTSFEIGEKGEFFNRRLRANVTGFYGDYSQRMLMAPGVECSRTSTPPYTCIPGLPFVPLITYVNAPAKIYGAELELEARPIDPLLFTLSGGYTRFVAGTTMFQGSPVSGIDANGEPDQVPEYNIAGSVQYTSTLPNGATITPRWDAYMQGRICSTNTRSSCTAGYVLHNVSIEYANENRTWVFSTGINNLMDTVYYYNTFDLTLYGEPNVEAQIAPPRTWYIHASYYFGRK